MIQMYEDVKNCIEIKTSLPGPKAEKIIADARKYIATGTACWDTPVIHEDCKGIWVRDVDGNTFMDWTNGMVVILGHGHPDWVKDSIEQTKKAVYFNTPDFPNAKLTALAKKLTELTPGDFEKKVFFCCSGAESIEAAFKLARIGTGKNLIINWLGDFHGRTVGALSSTASKAVQRRGYSYMLTNMHTLPYAYCYRCWYKLEYPSCEAYCARVLERYLKTLIPPEDVAAIIFEPMQGEGGYVKPPKEFYQVIDEIAKKHGILLIADEVQTCFGKSGYWFACEHFGIVPDIITLAKGFGNGAVIGAAVFRKELDFKAQGMHSNTFGGQLISLTGALSTIEIMEKENTLAHVKEVAKHFDMRLNELKEKYQSIGDVRTFGLLLAIEFVKDRTTKEPAGELRNRVLKECYLNGLLMIPCGESAIRITPSYCLKKEEIDLGIEIMAKAIEKAQA